MRQTTKIALTWEIFGQETPKIHIAEHVGVNRRTIHRVLEYAKQHRIARPFRNAVAARLPTVSYLRKMLRLVVF